MASRRSVASARHSWTKTLARPTSSVTTPTWARTSAIEGLGRIGGRVDVAPTASAAASNRAAVRSTIAHRTSCLEATWAYRLAPWMSSARAMSRTLVPA